MLESLLQELATLLETTVDKLQPEVELETFGNWDSLTKVTLISFLIDRQVKVDVAAFEQVQKVSDLIALVTPELVEAQS